jgi:hypothetical protein
MTLNIHVCAAVIETQSSARADEYIENREGLSLIGSVRDEVVCQGKQRAMWEKITTLGTELLIKSAW